MEIIFLFWLSLKVKNNFKFISHANIHSRLHQALAKPPFFFLDTKKWKNTWYLTETAKVPRARLPSRSWRISRTSCLAVDSTSGLLMHSNSLQSSPKSIPLTILSASELSLAGSAGDSSVLLESFVTACRHYWV